jgi:antitoxin (DNA-binding transcriptional repressor) of toxin-antitoxin stability system
VPFSNCHKGESLPLAPTAHEPSRETMGVFRYPFLPGLGGKIFFYISNMETMSIDKIKSQFSDVLKIVKKGKRVGVLYGKYKKPVAMIIPFAEDEMSSYEIGKSYFGKYGSGNGSLSQNYKKILKRKLNGKYSPS